MNVSPARVVQAWRAYGVQPKQAESFRSLTDPELVGKATDAVRLYLAPPQNAAVLCVDEKSRFSPAGSLVPDSPRMGRRERTGGIHP